MTSKCFYEAIRPEKIRFGAQRTLIMRLLFCLQSVMLRYRYL